jgi:hypothetical protein
VHASNTSTQETEAGESCVAGQPELLSKTLSQKKKKNRKAGGLMVPVMAWETQVTPVLVFLCFLINRLHDTSTAAGIKR